MKQIIMIICIFNGVLSQAKCASEGFYIVLNKNELNQNSCLLIEGYGNSQNFVESLTIDYPVYLETEENHKVKLVAKDYNRGAFNINQVILQPNEELIAGLSYQLKIENLDKAESIPYSLGPDQKQIAWQVIQNTSNEPAKLLTAPKLIKKDTTFYGCGPAVTAEFEFITDSDSTVLVKTELLDLADGTTRIYFLKTSKNDTLTIGHGMCSGAFRYEAKHQYQVRFSIMDNCNSYQDDWSEWIEFDSPYES